MHSNTDTVLCGWEGDIVAGGVVIVHCLSIINMPCKSTSTSSRRDKRLKLDTKLHRYTFIAHKLTPSKRVKDACVRCDMMNAKEISHDFLKILFVYFLHCHLQANNSLIYSTFDYAMAKCDFSVKFECEKIRFSDGTTWYRSKRKRWCRHDVA